MHHVKFLIIKPTRCTNFSIYSWNETPHVSDSSSVHHQEFFTVHTAMVYVIQVCKLSANRYDIYHCCVYIEKTPDDEQKNCPKHVEFHFNNKFEKLVDLVGIIIEIITMHGRMNVKLSTPSSTETEFW